MIKIFLRRAKIFKFEIPSIFLVTFLVQFLTSFIEDNNTRVKNISVSMIKIFLRRAKTFKFEIPSIFLVIFLVQFLTSLDGVSSKTIIVKNNPVSTIKNICSEISIILSFHRVLKTFAGGCHSRYKLGQKSEAMNDTGVEEKSDLKLR